jgi:hypothetical protein
MRKPTREDYRKMYNDLIAELVKMRDEDIKIEIKRERTGFRTAGHDIRMQPDHFEWDGDKITIESFQKGSS